MKTCNTLSPVIFAAILFSVPVLGQQPTKKIDFNRDVRSVLSNRCFKCHGPDETNREAELRLDTSEGVFAPAESGKRAVVPGKPDASELLNRLTAADPDERMPPADSGDPLSPGEIQVMRDWIAQGAPFARHWSYNKPTRPAVPDAGDSSWPRNDIDRFLLHRLRQEGLRPSPPVDRPALIRRVSLDLTGLPPTVEEVDRFVNDKAEDAYEQLVDRLLAKPSHGEHWARMWLDLARYADSAGYADDKPRTIWGYRDWVIRALNQNMPFDQFTIEQIAGDLLPDPTPDQLIATAFHRNTLTNNEGGTNDEEFRNEAIVDRVNTTMAVWMGTTVACAQCHNHKYDPISQEEFFRLFAVFNNTEDADRGNESPLLEIWDAAQKQRKADLDKEIAALEKRLQTSTPELNAAMRQWEQRFAVSPSWSAIEPGNVSARSGAAAKIAATGTVFFSESRKQDAYAIETTSKDAAKVTAVRLETLPHASLPNKGAGHAAGNFVVTRVTVSVAPPESTPLKGRFVRVENVAQGAYLHLSEVQAFHGSENAALQGVAKQSTTDYNSPAKHAIDGITGDANNYTHTSAENNPWWEVDLKSTQPIDRIVVWNRAGGDLYKRLTKCRVTLLDEQRRTVWEQTLDKPPNLKAELSLTGIREIKFVAAFADYSQPGFEASKAVDQKNPNASGWAVGPQAGKPHALTLIPQSPIDVPAGSKITARIEQLSKHENHVLGNFRLSLTQDSSVADFAKIPSSVLAAAIKPVDKRTPAETAELTKHYLGIAPELAEARKQLAAAKKQLGGTKATSTVPIMRELTGGRRRKTKIQRRGNFLEIGKEVTAGLPSAFHPVEAGKPINRLTLAEWLVDENNPLTSRVVANRYWETIFGRGIVTTSEEFGSQGDPPTHPELLDWLAVELIQMKWDMKAFLKLLVTSSAYRQSARVSRELYERDPENLLLARGPRFRLSAEMIRDQALFVGGLLSDKMHGPPVRPPQPKMGVSAAFGSGIDWKTSSGPDRYRRGLYTTWRRSNPYPSMAAFDAPNREVCTIRRDRTNTPLQALVTLNDPVYFEAAQALARRMTAAGDSVEQKATLGFRACLARNPSDAELKTLTNLFERTRERLSKTLDQAKRLATVPLGPIPEGADPVELAAWTIVGNVLLNLDEMFLKR
ncbi:MAG: DUF1553 domain-containing protein [Planctomycetales bacterium]